MEWNARTIQAERAAALRGEQFTESVIRSNPDIARRITGGQLVSAADANAELLRLQCAGECLQHSTAIAMQERASEAADAAKLRSEVTDALKHIEMLKAAGQRVVQESQEEAERHANVANMLRKHLDIEKEKARQAVEAANAESNATAERRYKEGLAQGESKGLINQRAERVRASELENKLRRYEASLEMLKRQLVNNNEVKRSGVLFHTTHTHTG